MFNNKGELCVVISVNPEARGWPVMIELMTRLYFDNILQQKCEDKP